MKTHFATRTGAAHAQKHLRPSLLSWILKLLLLLMLLLLYWSFYGDAHGNTHFAIWADGRLSKDVADLSANLRIWASAIIQNAKGPAREATLDIKKMLLIS